MILLFPSDDVLRLALTSGLIPPAISQATARAHRDADGQTWVDAGPFDSATKRNLARAGASFPSTAPPALDLKIAGWLQLLPLRRQLPLRDISDKTPILFELGDPACLAEVVNEILRLGNDRQGFRWVGDDGHELALLRVLGPPYYTLLRALDNERRSSMTVAYREAQPRVWVELGYEHPLEGHLRPPEGQLLLLRAPQDWRTAIDGPYRDIYEVLELTCAAPTNPLTEKAREARWQVPLRLVAAGGDETAELHVLRNDPVGQVDALVRNSNDQLLARLAFAVGESGGATVIVVRVRPSRQAPPVLVLDGVGYRSYLRLSQLYLPTGRRLHPPLRRDVVAKRVAPDPERITWLRPLEGSAFQAESLPESAFRSLSEWVEYVIEREQAPLTAWIGAHRFAFESFVCDEEKERDKPPPKPPRKPRPETPSTSGRKKGTTANKDSGTAVDEPDEPISLDPSAIEKELRGLEKSFLEMTSPLEADDRPPLWLRMAHLNGELGHHDAAAICWAHALWESDGLPAESLKRGWHTDIAGEKSQPLSTAVLANLEKIVHRALPRTADLRRLAIGLAVADAEKIDTPLIGKALRFLEQHERKLGVRMVWLAWAALHRISHGDVLTLAKARDRVLERLHQDGLSPDFDLPSFVRFTGAQAGDRFRLLQDHLARLRPLMQKWADEGYLHIPGTRVYVDLLFAYGLTRLGEAGEARTIAEQASTHLPATDEVHGWLIDAFLHRIRRAALGTADRERLPDELLERLGEIDRLSRYKIDRLREHSRILEPTEKIDPYRAWHGHAADELSRTLSALFDINDRELLARRVHELLPTVGAKGKQPWGPQAEPRILATALELAPRLGDQFSEDLLFRLRRLLKTAAKPNERLFLLEKGLFLAGHYDKADEVGLLLEHVENLLAQDDGSLSAGELESLLGHTLRSLRRLGLRDQVARLLHATQRTTQLQAAYEPGPQQASAMRLQLQVAGGWYYFGQEAKGRRILDDARALLLENRLSATEQTALACAYIAALGTAPLEVTLARLMEFFRKATIPADTFTTSSHFSLTRLDIVEAVILTLVHEDVTVEPRIRRWLDDDEYLVRRRIHRDVHEAMRKAGLS